MNLEQLIAAGLTEAQAKEVLKLHKAAIDGSYVPKETFEAERTKVKTANDTITERDKQIKELGAFKGTAEELQAKVTKLEGENKTANEKYTVDLLKAQNDATIKLELHGKVVDADDVLPKLDMTKITFKDGKITAGLTEQLDELKKVKPHYFPAEKNPGGLPGGFNFFGKTPPEGNDGKGGGGDNKPTQTDAQKFGAALASMKTSGDVVAAKGAEVYFK